MPTVAAVKQLVSVWAQARNDVLEIRRRARYSPESRRIQQAASAGEEDEADQAATDLEAARTDVLVWQTIAREMQNRPQEDGSKPGPASGTGCGARSNMKRNNHRLLSPTTWPTGRSYVRFSPCG
jgi:hypothetical protein